MNKIILSILVLISTISIIGESNKRELVEELFILQNMESTLDSMYDKIEQFQQNMIQQLKVKPSQQARFNESRAKISTLMKEEMSWEKIKNPMIDVYLKHYSAVELQDMVTFYKSETGKSMTTKMPLVIADSMALTQALMIDFIPKMQAITKKMKDELADSRGSAN